MSSDLQAAFEEAAIEVMGELKARADESTPIEELGIDSLGLIEVVMLVEERLGIVTEFQDFEGVVTVGDAVAVFRRLVAAGS